MMFFSKSSRAAQTGHATGDATKLDLVACQLRLNGVRNCWAAYCRRAIAAASIIGSPVCSSLPGALFVDHRDHGRRRPCCRMRLFRAGLSDERGEVIRYD